MRLIGLAAVLALDFLVATPAAEAQRVPEIGLLIFGTEQLSLNAERGMRALREGLRSFGWSDGQSITLTPRFADLKEERLAALAQEFVQAKVEVIVAIGTPATAAARRATTSVPIVMSGAAIPSLPGSHGTSRGQIQTSPEPPWS